MKREIRYRVGGYNSPRLLEVKELKFGTLVGTIAVTDEGEFRLSDEGVVLFEYTGLKDKKNMEYIYEGDILAPDGTIAGNRYENEDLLKDPSYILIEGMGTAAWRSAEQAAMERGCAYSK